MTYRELNDLFFKTWADEKGLIHGRPVLFIYTMNKAAGVNGLDAQVDMNILQSELDRRGLVLGGM